MKTESMLQNNLWFKEDIKKKIKMCCKWNKNENAAYQNLQDTTKAVVRGKFIALMPMLENEKDAKLMTSASILSS